MTLKYDNHEIEVIIVSNPDGSRSIDFGYNVSLNTNLTREELDKLQSLYDTYINSNYPNLKEAA
jgi:hypothetical protein